MLSALKSPMSTINNVITASFVCVCGAPAVARRVRDGKGELDRGGRQRRAVQRGKVELTSLIA